MPYRNQVRSVISQCQIVTFPYVNQVIDEASSLDEVLKTTVLDVSNYLETCNFSKSLSSPAGTFSFTLANGRDWKALIKPGTWCLIYMSNDGDLAIPSPADKNVLPSDLVKQKNKLRGICYIERVAVRGNEDDKGVVDISYEFSGTDIGGIYENTDIWHNFLLFESSFIDSLNAVISTANVPTIDSLLKTIHDLFFNPKAIAALANNSNLQAGDSSLIQVGAQWALPTSMLDALQIELEKPDFGTYFGNLQGLLDNVQEVKTTWPIDNIFGNLDGNAWQKLRSYSIEPLHELFVETDDKGIPRLNFRPHPFKYDPTGYPTIEPTVPSLNDVWNEFGITLNTVDILNWEVAEDDHTRYNHFYLNIESQNYSAQNSISILRDKESDAGKLFPFAEPNSISRHGFKPMHTTLNSLSLFLKDGTGDPGLLVEYNEVLYDYWNNSVFYENGTLQQIGRNEIKIGRAVAIEKGHPYIGNRLFYVESYSDEFVTDEKGTGEWTQNLVFTHGIDFDVMREIIRQNSDVSPILNTENQNDIGSYIGKNNGKN